MRIYSIAIEISIDEFTWLGSNMLKIFQIKLQIFFLEVSFAYLCFLMSFIPFLKLPNLSVGFCLEKKKKEKKNKDKDLSNIPVLKRALIGPNYLHLRVARGGACIKPVAS